MQDKKVVLNNAALMKEFCKGLAAVIVSLMFLCWRLGQTWRSSQSPESIDRFVLFGGLSCLAGLLFVSQLSDWIQTRSRQSAWRCFLALGITIFMVVQTICIYQGM